MENNPKLQYYATSYALGPSELYIGFPVKKYFKARRYSNPTHCSNRELFAKVFLYFFKLVILDIIDNNVTFKFPPGTRAWLEMKNIQGDDFVKAYLNGAFQDIDYLATNFVGNLIVLKYTTRYGKWEKVLNVCHWMKDKITNNTNAGKQYG